MSKTAPQQLSPALLAARKLLGDYINRTDGGVTMEDQLGIIDRLIKIEALEFKMTGQKSGAAFDEDDE